MTSIDGSFEILSPSLTTQIINDANFIEGEATPIHRLERHTLRLYAPAGTKVLYRWIY